MLAGIRQRLAILSAALLLAAASLRLFRLDHFSYGLDEILQAYWIQGSWEFFWRSLKFDAIHPPLDYLVVRFLEAADPADWGRKIPAVVWGLGTIVSAGALLARRAGGTAGFTGAALLAFAPFHVRYSQELRPYSLGLFLLCLSLLALEFFLARPGRLRLALLFLSTLATAYALYLAALVLGIAAYALLAEDSFSTDPPRRLVARRSLAWSPLFLALLFVAYLPWWPTVLEAARRPPFAEAPPWTWERLARLLSFFAFAPDDGQPLGRKGPLFLVMLAAGLALALRRRGLRFLAAWAAGGFLAIEILGRLHPHYDFSRRFLPAGLAFPFLAALPLAALLEKKRLRPLGAFLLALVLVFDLRSLALYYREGRADWRTLADFLRRAAAPEERIFTENQYSQLCVAFYLVGPHWLFRGGRGGREVLNLEGELIRLTWSWYPKKRAWLILAGEPVHPPTRQWAQGFPSFSFPKAEGAVAKRLDPELREASLGLAR